MGLILVKNGAFTPDELAAVREFCRAQGLDLVALPGLAEAETNRYNVLDEPVYYRAFQPAPGRSRNPLRRADATTSAHRPTTGPSSSTFSGGARRGPSSQLGRTWQPWGGSGYFVLVALLAVAAVTSAGS